MTIARALFELFPNLQPPFIYSVWNSIIKTVRNKLMHIINSVSEYYLHQKDWKMDQVKLESMQYQELQKLAKKVGIRANLPKAELVVALFEKDENSLVESSVPLEESKLDTTFEIVNDSKQNVLNETFEKDSMCSLGNINDSVSSSCSKLESTEENQDTTLETLDESTVGSRVEEGGVNFNSRRRRRTRSVTARKSVGVTNQTAEYLSKKNKTPLRATIKTPGSIQKKTESHIPRFVQYANKIKRGKIPDCAKVDEMNLMQMESLDGYLLEKTKKITDSIRKLLEETNNTTKSKIKTFKNVDEDNVALVPAVTSTAKINLNFGKAKENYDQQAFQYSAMSNSTVPFKFTAEPVAAALKVKPKERLDLKACTKKKLDIRSKTTRKCFSNLTPSKPFLSITNNANKSVNKVLTETSNKKFNLAASLAKPLNYKPHTGKLKPWEKKNKEVFSIKDSFSHDETRQRQMAAIKGVRLNKRAELLMNRRKILDD